MTAVAAPTVVGDGVLATAITTAITTAIAEALAGHGLAELRITATDTWSRPVEPTDVPRIGVHAELGRVVIGPLELPGRPGCTECVRWRRRQALEARDAYDALVREHQDSLAASSSAWLTELAAATIGALVADECTRFTSDLVPRTDGAIIVVNLAGLTVSRHPFLPNSRCETCGQLPDDSPTDIVLTSQRKLGPGVHRTRAIADELDMLKQTYVDPEAGIIAQVFRGAMGGLPVAAAPFRILDDISRYESGFGRTRSYRTSELTAILEALERLGGIRPGGKRTVVRGSYAELSAKGHTLLDPRTVGLHPDSNYDRPGFHYRRFTEDAVCRWVWGYSLTRSQPVLVPETLAYYRLDSRDPDERGFCYEISNGCALGSSVAEAVAHGLLEVVERDAFLMTWYARLPVPRFDIDSAGEQVRITAEAIRTETGFDVHVFDTTMEHGIPSAWALAIGPDGTWPNTACAAGAAFDAEHAILNALNELGPITQGLKERDPSDADRAGRMVHDPALVAAMEDHSTLYAHPDALARLDFLTGSTRTVPVPDPDPAFRHDDLRDDLGAAIARFEAAGMEVIVVDQTAPEHRATGLACVKVLAPGALPMTFGHHHRRVDGLPRLSRLSAEVNPHPHPFP